MSLTTATVATRADLNEVASALARAFEADPVVRYAFPSDRVRVARMRTFFKHTIGGAWARREVFTTADHAGAAVWAGPDEWKATPGYLLRGLLPAILRSRPRARALMGYLATDKLHPAEPHWFLETLGTIPERQGKGVGAELLRPTLDRCDEQGLAAWTWSSNERNLAFYHRHGFEVLERLDFVPGGPPIFPIRRAPRG